MRSCTLRLFEVGATLGLLAFFILVAGNNGQVGLAQAGGLPVRTLGFGDVLSVAFSPDGRYLAVGTSGGSSVQLIDTSSWRVVRTFESHSWSVFSVAFSPDGKLLASGSGDWTIKLWEVSTGDLIRTLRG
ncbi:MAG: WD40 repeat domain-containing protein, partial [Candidatus Bipolaricaulia bacterium]